MLVSEARTEFDLELKDTSNVSSTLFVKWCDYINKFAYRILVKQDPARWIDTSSYTVSTSPSTQALPSDFRSITPWGTGFYKVDDSGTQTGERLPRTGFGNTTEGYYILGTDVVFTGINTSTVFTLRYIPTISAITATTDSFVIPDEYNRYVLDALKVQYMIWDEDIPGESYADARFVRSLDELMNNIRKDVSVYDLSNFSTSF